MYIVVIIISTEIALETMSGVSETQGKVAQWAKELQ